MDYVPRTVDAELDARLAASGAVVIEGPKACGKTVTARQRSASEVLLDTDDNARRAVAVAPAVVLEGATPRLIDEWQIEPAVWNHVRRAVDDRREPGQFILTGSASPADDITRHTWAGRLARVRMRTMSLHETGHSTGAISLGDLLDGNPTPAGDPGVPIDELANRVAVGGWPAQLGRPVVAAAGAVRAYLEEIRRTDIQRVDGVERDPQRVGRLLRSLARNVSTEVANATLAADAGGADGPLNVVTVSDYLRALTRLMIIEDQPAWAPHLRSKSRLRSTPKRHFVDPSLAVAALGASADRLLGDLNLFGLLFESLVVRDLRIYAQAHDAQVLHYRDNTGLEVDAIVETIDGRWAALEVKLGGDKAIDEASANLHRFESRIDTDRCGRPGALAVVVAGGYGYVRDDGIAVYPLASLAP
jgi:uncharacterized protein